MNQQPTTERQAVVEEARTWIKTPFSHKNCVKGAGVDCVHMPAAVYDRVLGTEYLAIFRQPPFSEYSPQWHLHTKDGEEEVRELYLDGLNLCGFVEIKQSDAQPGDLVVSKIGRTFCHGAIIVNWPKVIQAEAKPYGRHCVCDANAIANWFLSGRELKFFTRKEWLFLEARLPNDLGPEFLKVAI